MSYVQTGCKMSGYGERECTETAVLKPSRVQVKECRECQAIEDYGADFELVRWVLHRLCSYRFRRYNQGGVLMQFLYVPFLESIPMGHLRHSKV